MKSLSDYKYPRKEDEMRVRVPMTGAGMMGLLQYRLMYGTQYLAYWNVIKNDVNRNWSRKIPSQFSGSTTTGGEK